MKARWLAVATMLAMTFLLVPLGSGSLARALWPALVALVTITLLGRAALGLFCGVAAGAVLLADGDMLAMPRIVLHDHLFPAMQGPWKIGALVFTLLLGAFAALLERSGAFESLLRRFLAGGEDSERRLLGGAYVVGLMCFFDGLASTMLAGRLAQPLADRAGVAREKLAWVVDSTGSPVACVAFISTWIATQLSLIAQGLAKAPFPVDPYALFFQAVPANAYCLLTLLLVPLAIASGWEPAAMRRFAPRRPAAAEAAPVEHVPLRVVLVPLAVLVTGILAGFPLLAKDHVDVLTVAGWRAAFSGDGGPYALVFGSVLGVVAAWAMFPASRRHEAAAAAVGGAATLIPALVILVFAWSLGSVFEALGAAKHIAGLLAGSTSVFWMPLAVFLLGCVTAFCTGSSWGTMGLLMALALPATLLAGQQAALAPGELQPLAAMVIGAVFGGATFGDHCSPFSDTTIVSALSSGCDPVDHVTSQLPYALLAAGCACGAYVLMALGTPAIAATSLMAVGLALLVWLLAMSTRGRERLAEAKESG